MATAEFYKFAGILSAALSQHHLSGFGIAPLYLLLWAGIPQKKWQEYTEELYKKDLHDLDNHNGVITDLEPDILECEIKRALASL